jgi:hypothetical protein
MIRPARFGVAGCVAGRSGPHGKRDRSVRVEMQERLAARRRRTLSKTPMTDGFVKIRRCEFSRPVTPERPPRFGSVSVVTADQLPRLIDGSPC